MFVTRSSKSSCARENDLSCVCVCVFHVRHTPRRIDFEVFNSEFEFKVFQFSIFFGSVGCLSKRQREREKVPFNNPFCSGACN